MKTKLITLAAAAALTLGWSQVGHAQVTGTTSSGATATATSGGLNLPPGSVLTTGGAAPAGTIPATQYVHTTVGGTTWTLGGTTGGNSVTSYDACLKNAQLTVLFAAVAVPLEISHCWELRDMDAMAKFPPGSIQYEHGCRDSSWLNTDWVSGTMACTANKAKLAKSNPSDPRAMQVQAVPVVSTQMSPSVPAGPPPTVVPVKQMSEATPVVDYSRPCRSRTDEQCTSR